jgi:hypothetical protein
MGFFAFIMTLVIGILVLASGFKWLWGNQGEPLPRADTERFDRIESALVSLEARLDDLAEQQRFLERLLEHREPPSLGPGEGGGEGGADATDADSVLFDTDPPEEDR